MKKNNIHKALIRTTASICILLMMSCTDKFEEYNTNPYGPTPKQMIGDNAATGSLLKDMFPVLVQGQQNSSQHIDQMIGAEYGGHIANIATWGNNGNFYTYNPRPNWSQIPFTSMMPQIYTAFFRIRQESNSKGLAYHWAQILRVAGSLKISDCYGPIPYSKVTGSEYAVAYDPMDELYTHMFQDLDNAINSFSSAVLANDDLSSLGEYDLIYEGDFRKWIKFANTLKLRMAMRIASVAPQIAQQKAEEAVNDIIGVMESASDAAYSPLNDGMNPFYRVAVSWNEIRVSANITSFLGGYNDPRLAQYASLSTLSNPSLVGVRNGIAQTDATQAQYARFSRPNLKENDPQLIMSASEAYFLRAEGALRGWNMKETAQTLYESGVSVSMNERKVEIGNYLTNINPPADYVDPVDSKKNRQATTSIYPKWEEKDTFEQKLERILTQKWIANYPNGWETWADVRRTGYPKLFPIVNNLSQDGVTIQRGMRRLPYPEKEYNTNEKNVRQAASLLSGPDNAATDLWWAKKD